MISMPDQVKASQLARNGFDLWQAGRLEESVTKYREALECVDPNHYALADYHGEFAAVLAALGRDADALEQYQLALTESVRQDPEEHGAGVAMARHFLGDQLVSMNEPTQALAIVEPPQRCGAKYEWLMHLVQAEALWQLGRTDEARHVANIALEIAPSEQNRNNIRQGLAFILNRDAG